MIMAREIKFRGKDILSGDWRYGYAQFNYDKTRAQIISPLRIDISAFPGQFFHVDKDTVSQFTGLRDKNGKDIYEGDILGVDINGMNKKLIGMVEGGVRGYCYDVVYLNHPKGEERWSLYGTVIHDFPNKIEVIGNIHDNPELLEE